MTHTSAKKIFKYEGTPERKKKKIQLVKDESFLKVGEGIVVRDKVYSVTKGLNRGRYTIKFEKEATLTYNKQKRGIRNDQEK